MAETWEQLAEARKHQLEKLGPVEEKSKALKQSEGLTVEFVIPPARNDD